MDEIIVCHYRPNTDRRSYLESLGLPFRFITDFDREVLPEPEPWDELKPKSRLVYSKLAPILIANVALAQRHQSQTFNYESALASAKDYLSNSNVFEDYLNRTVKPLTNAERSIFLKHKAAIAEAAKAPSAHSVIIEDDCIFPAGSIERLREEFSQWGNVDFLDLAGGVNFNPVGVFEQSIYIGRYLISPPMTRTLCGYAISKSFAEKVTGMIEKPIVAVDHFMSFCMTTLDAKVHWQEPTLLKHGSELSYYRSSVR